MLFLKSYARLSSFASENEAGKPVLDNSGQREGRCTRYRKIFFVLYDKRTNPQEKVTNISSVT